MGGDLVRRRVPGQTHSHSSISPYKISNWHSIGQLWQLRNFHIFCPSTTSERIQLFPYSIITAFLTGQMLMPKLEIIKECSWYESHKAIIRRTSHTQQASYHGDLFGIPATSYVKIRIIYNIYINGEFRIKNEEPWHLRFSIYDWRFFLFFRVISVHPVR